MYVAVKGGERAIANAHAWLAESRRGNPDVPELTVAQIREQQKLAVDRVMTEGSLYDPDLAALALKQACGDQVEAIFLLRAYRTTLPRFGATLPIDTAEMTVRRRVSAVFKDIPGGQILGSTFDYTHRLLDFALMAEGEPAQAPVAAPAEEARVPGVIDVLNREDIIEIERPSPGDPAPPDLTREPLRFPAPRAMRLQNLARGDEGFVLAMGYATQRGYGRTHPFAGEIRHGTVPVEMVPPELGFAVDIGDVELTECQMVNQFAGSKSEPPQFTRGYGVSFGHGERKAMGMALVDRALRAQELGEATDAPPNDIEFVLYHSDNVEAQGFVQHLKLPHYVDFQSELNVVRAMRRDAESARQAALKEAAE